MGSLYVGDLRADVDEFDLLHIFNAAGKISSIHVCRDTETKESLGYAYVNYSELNGAENALIQLNFRRIKGRSCRVMWSHHVKESKVAEGGNVFVKNLDKHISNRDLHEIFSAFGKIISCKVATSDQEQSLGYGYVHFERTVDADKAITKANRMFINGKEIRVEYFRPKGERMQQNTTKKSQFFQSEHLNQAQENRTNLYVKHLDAKVTDGELKGLFLRFGEIISAKIERDQHNISRRFGFVCFRSAIAAARAIEEMNGALISDRWIYVGYAQKKSERRELVSQLFNANRPGPAKYTPNPDTAHIKQSLTDSKPKYSLPKRHSFSSSTSDQLTNQQRHIRTRSATNSASVQSPTTACTWTPSTRTRNMVTSLGTHTGIGNVSRPVSLISNELPLRQRSRVLSSSSERLSDHVSSVKIRSVPSSPTREFSQNFTFEQQTNFHPLTPNNSFQSRNVEAKGKDKFDKQTQLRELISQASKQVDSIQHRNSRWEAKCKDPISPTRETCLRKPIPNHEDYCLRPKIANKAKHEVRKSSSQEYLNDQCVSLKAGNGKEFENDKVTCIQPPVPASRKPRLEPVNNIEASVNEKPNLNSKIILDELRSMNPSKQKETLGAIIFPTIHSLYPEQATKICETMLLTFGVEEMIQMFQSREILKSRIKIIKENLSNPPLNLGHNKDRIESKYRTSVLIETDVCMGIRTVEDKIYDTAKREYPNEANLIVGLITEKCSKDQLQLLASSETLLEHEVEKARAKIRILETPVCKNY